MELGNSPKFACPCCGFLTFVSAMRDSYDGCPVCAWEDDPVQFLDPSFEGGANEPSLEQARENFRAFGVSDPSRSQYVRPPLEYERPKQ
jgi:hypothetical protein